MKNRTRIRKPLLGFGWAGYTASVILLALIVTVIAGVDLRHELIRLIYVTVGDRAAIFFLLQLHWIAYAFCDPVTRVGTGIGILVAFTLSPYRFGVTRLIILFVLCTCWPLVTIQARHLGDYSIFGNSILAVLRGRDIVSCLGTVLIAAICIQMTRSWIVVIAWTIAVCIQFYIEMFVMTVRHMLPEGSVLFSVSFSYSRESLYTWFSLLFDLCTIGSLLLWAILERRKPIPARLCPACGYDLAGLPETAICPECGRKPAIAAT